MVVFLVCFGFVCFCFKKSNLSFTVQKAASYKLGHGFDEPNLQLPVSSLLLSEVLGAAPSAPWSGVALCALQGQAGFSPTLEPISGKHI